MKMKQLYSCLELLVLISHVYGLPKWGLQSKKPQVYRPTYCLTLPFNSNCKPLPPRWYYDPRRKTCLPIGAEYHVKGHNNFASLQKCSEMCNARAKVIYKECLTPPKITASRAVKYAWYFEEQTKLCKMFTFNTCNSSNGNYFASELKCESVCLPKMKPAPRCSADPIPDLCLIQRKHFFFSFRNNTCMQFPKKGCGKGANSFASIAKCIDMCSYNQSTMACPDCELNNPDELPPKGKPMGPNIMGPVSSLHPTGLPAFPSPQITQGTHSSTALNGTIGLPSSVHPTPANPIQVGMPVSNSTPSIQGGNPTQPAQSTQSVTPGTTFSSGTPTSQSTPSSGNAGLPATPIKPSQQGKTTDPFPPTVPNPQSPLSSPGPRANAQRSGVHDRITLPTKPHAPVTASKPTSSRRAALPLRAGFHTK